MIIPIGTGPIVQFAIEVKAILTDPKSILGEKGKQTGTADPVFNSGDEVALMVNGLGGTPILELYLVYGYAHKKLEEKGIKIWRSYVGEYCTSLEMAGMSITLCKVDDQLKKLFTAPAEIPIHVLSWAYALFMASSCDKHHADIFLNLLIFLFYVMLYQHDAL